MKNYDTLIYAVKRICRGREVVVADWLQVEMNKSSRDEFAVGMAVALLRKAVENCMAPDDLENYRRYHGRIMCAWDMAHR